MRLWTGFVLVLLAGSGTMRATLRHCGAARDLVVQSLERVSASSTPAQVRDANELLKRSAQMCTELGDAWYYRSVMERRLGDTRAAEFALGRAKLIGSEAMEDGTDPFHLATPEASMKPIVSALNVGTKWALVIGIGKFSDASIGSLRFAASDAQLFLSSLRDPKLGGFREDHVRVLVDGAATTRAMKESLNWIARQAKPEDVVVVYVATHGSARDMDSVGGVNYLITADTVVGASDDEDSLYATAFPMIDLVNTISGRIRALRTAIFLDTCYSGSSVQAEAAGAKMHAVDERTLEQFKQGSGRIIMTASGENQESMESDKLGHGYFTYYLDKALRAKGQARPLSAVFEDVHHDVMTTVAMDFKAYHLKQEPMFSRSSEETDFSLGAAGR